MRWKGKAGVKGDSRGFGVTGWMGPTGIKSSQRCLCRAKPDTLSFDCRFICGGLDGSLMKTIVGGGGQKDSPCQPLVMFPNQLYEPLPSPEDQIRAFPSLIP